jgi:hypothetical protein
MSRAASTAATTGTIAVLNHDAGPQEVTDPKHRPP